MGLIPEAWFRRRSTFTGQEAFLPRRQVLERIQRILDLKDRYSLEQIAEMFSPDAPLHRIDKMVRRTTQPTWFPPTQEGRLPRVALRDRSRSTRRSKELHVCALSSNSHGPSYEGNDGPAPTRAGSQGGAAAGSFWIRAVLWLGNLHRRMLGVYLAILGPRVAYLVTGLLARSLYRLLEPLRVRSEAQCRAALGGRVRAEEISRIAERSFVHRVWNLTDLMLAERLLHPDTYHRYGGKIPQPYLRRLLAAQQRGQPTVLLTGYYGPFDLLPVFLGYNGIRAGVVYQPHAHEEFDIYRRRIRARSGCELILVDRAAERLGQILAAGGTVAIVADHHADRRGMPVTFLGLPTKAMRSVGLLAWRYKADVIVAGIRRLNDEFRFEIVVADILERHEWQRQDDPVAYITERYLRGLEKIILADPTQYVWGYARWGEDFARRLLAGNQSARADR